MKVKSVYNEVTELKEAYWTLDLESEGTVFKSRSGR